MKCPYYNEDCPKCNHKIENPMNNREWEGFDHWWASLPMDIRSYKSVIEEHQYFELKEIVKSMLTSHNEALVTKIKELPTHPAGYAKERMIKPSDVLSIINGK